MTADDIDFSARSLGELPAAEHDARSASRRSPAGTSTSATAAPTRRPRSRPSPRARSRPRPICSSPTGGRRSIRVRTPTRRDPRLGRRARASSYRLRAGRRLRRAADRGPLPPDRAARPAGPPARRRRLGTLGRRRHRRALRVRSRRAVPATAPSGTPSPDNTPDMFTVTLRLRVTDDQGRVGEARRTVYVHHDPDLLEGVPARRSAAAASRRRSSSRSRAAGSTRASSCWSRRPTAPCTRRRGLDRRRQHVDRAEGLQRRGRGGHHA